MNKSKEESTMIHVLHSLLYILLRKKSVYSVFFRHRKALLYIILNKRYENSDYDVIKRTLLYILVFACIFEIILYPTFNSILLSITSIVSLLVFNNYIFNQYLCLRYPIAFFTLMNGFLFMYLPIPVTLFDGHPADHNLYMPITTYIMQLIYFLVTVAAFRYVINRKSKIRRLSLFLKKSGYFPNVSVSLLWFLGIIGCIPRIIIMMTHTQHGAGTLSTLSNFMYAPVCILFMPLFGNRKCSKSTSLLVLIYIVFIMLLLMGTNGRHYMITPLIILIGATLFTYFIKSYLYSSILNIKKVILIVISILIFSGPLSDMATAMVLVRNIRGDVSFIELMKETFICFQDKESLQKFRDAASDAMEGNSSSSAYDDWDEHYVSNVFLERFCNYRVVDASLYHSFKTGMANLNMLKYFLHELLRLPPGPIPSLYGVDKSEERYSPMDFMYALSTNTKPFPSLRVGGDVGLGLATFGVFYFFIQFWVYVFLFRLLCSFCIPQKGKYVISFFAMIQLMDLFNLLTVHYGIVTHVGFIGWSFWWNSFLLILIFQIITKLFPVYRKNIYRSNS